MDENNKKERAHEDLINTFIDLLKEMDDVPQDKEVEADKEEKSKPEKKDEPK